jgi:hypothetical protein
MNAGSVAVRLGRGQAVQDEGIFPGGETNPRNLMNRAVMRPIQLAIDKSHDKLPTILPSRFLGAQMRSAQRARNPEPNKPFLSTLPLAAD